MTMIIGDPKLFAIESCISIAYASTGFRARGYFTIFVNGRQYGVRELDATMLACSLQEVERRIANQGSHREPLSDTRDAAEIAEAFRRLYYSDTPECAETSAADKNLCGHFYARNIVWAPDGDAAFDDSSYILQFDLDDRVRLIAFRATEHKLVDHETLNEAFLKSDEFYGILKQWRHSFLDEWTTLPQLQS